MMQRSNACVTLCCSALVALVIEVALQETVAWSTEMPAAASEPTLRSTSLVCATCAEPVLRLRGGRRQYVTPADLRRAGIDPDFDPRAWEYEDWGAVQRSRRLLPGMPEPLFSWVMEPGADEGDESEEITPYQHATMLAQMQRIYLPHEELHKGEFVSVLGIAFDGTFDNETTVIMQLRLSMERADFHALRRALHNAAELPFWTSQLDAAFELGNRVLVHLHRKEDSRLHHVITPKDGPHHVTTEELCGLRAPLPPRLAETPTTYADLVFGPRDATTRLRIDPDLGMDENLALWDALDSHYLSSTVFPELNALTFADDVLEAIYQTKVAAPPEGYHPTVRTPWPALKSLALKRAHEAKTYGERGEVGSAWYHAERCRDCELPHEHRWQDFPVGDLRAHTCAPECDQDHQHRYAHLAAIRLNNNGTDVNRSCAADAGVGVWWYLHGAVVRRPALLWRNGRYTSVDETEDPDGEALMACPHCDFADCEHIQLERARIVRCHKWQEMKRRGYPQAGEPIVLARLAALPVAELNSKLHAAVRNASMRAAALCVQAGAQLEWRDPVGMTALHVAAQTGSVEICEAVLQLGAQVNARTATNATALHFAADRGATPVIQTLARAGADMNAVDVRHNTALHLAADEGWNATVAALCALGSDPWLPNVDGDYALNLAERRYHCPTTMLLRKSMGLELCECHSCAGFTTGYNNMLQPHITHNQTTAFWRDSFDVREWHPKPFWDEMQDGEDYVEEYTRNYYAKNPPQPDTWVPVDEPSFEPVSFCS